ncbi:MAG: hypothetical protein QXZ06_03680 [Candidatus Jordarchaeales archaeon]
MRKHKLRRMSVKPQRSVIIRYNLTFMSCLPLAIAKETEIYHAISLEKWPIAMIVQPKSVEPRKR